MVYINGGAYFFHKKYYINFVTPKPMLIINFRWHNLSKQTLECEQYNKFILWNNWVCCVIVSISEKLIIILQIC